MWRLHTLRAAVRCVSAIQLYILIDILVLAENIYVRSGSPWRVCEAMWGV